MMMFRRLALALSLLLPAAAGCATSGALEKGHQLVAARDYRAAFEQYRLAAADDPDDPQLRRLLAQIAPYAVQQAVDDTGGAVRDGRWEDARAHIDYVTSIEPARGGAMEQDASRLMRAAIEAQLLSGEMDAAYPLAARARRLFPAMTGLDHALQRLRRHFIANSEAHADAGRFEEALAELDTIEEHEPAMKRQLLSRRSAIRGRWADTLVADAEHAESAGDIGVATVLYGRAFEVAGRSADADQMRRLRRVLIEEGRFWLSVDIDGHAARSQRLDDMVRTRMLTIDGVALRDEREGSAMEARLHAEPPSCEQRETTSRASKDYVAGHREVDNPQWLGLDRDLHAAADELAACILDVGQKKRAAEQQWREATRAEEQQCRPAEQALAVAEAAAEAADARVAEQRRRVSGLRAASDGDRVRRAEQRLRELDAQARQARHDATGARRRRDGAARQCDDKRRRADQAAGDLTEARATTRAIRAKVRLLDRERGATARTVSEPIIETFRYTVRHIERTCGGDIALHLTPSWSAASSHVIGGQTSTKDSTHPAHSRYGVSEDPLELPASDRDLVTAADRQAADKLRKTVTAKVRDYYRTMSRRALEESDAASATAMMIALHGAAPKQIDGIQKAAFAQALHRRYGLESLATLTR